MAIFVLTVDLDDTPVKEQAFDDPEILATPGRRKEQRPTVEALLSEVLRNLGRFYPVVSNVATRDGSPVTLT